MSPRRSLMRPIEGALDLDFRGVEISLFPGAEAILDLRDGLQPRRWSFGEVIETLIILVALDRVEPNELYSGWWSHFRFTNKPNSPIMWAYLLGVTWNTVSPKYLRTSTKKRCKENLTPNIG